MGVVQSGDDGPALPIKHRRRWASLAQTLLIGPDRTDFAIRDGECLNERRRPICRDLRVVKYAIGRHRGLPSSIITRIAEEPPCPHPYLSAAGSGTTYSSYFVPSAPCPIPYTYST